MSAPSFSRVGARHASRGGKAPTQPQPSRRKTSGGAFDVSLPAISSIVQHSPSLSGVETVTLDDLPNITTSTSIGSGSFGTLPLLSPPSSSSTRFVFVCHLEAPLSILLPLSSPSYAAWNQTPPTCATDDSVWNTAEWWRRFLAWPISAVAAIRYAHQHRGTDAEEYPGSIAAC